MQFWITAGFFPPEHYLPVAREADRAGITGMLFADHIFTPKSFDSRYPYASDGDPGWPPDAPFPDCWVTIGALTSVTERLRFATSVYVAPSRDLFTVARLVGTAAVMSGNRVALGVGAGWHRNEYEQTGQDFSRRGRRLNEMIPALRVLWSDGWVEHHGSFFDFGPLQMAPAPSAPIPIWCGGYSDAALSRATELCDGWIGVVPSLKEGHVLLEDLRRRRDQSGRADQPFDVILSVPTAMTPEMISTWAGRGVTGLICRPWARRTSGPSPDLAIDQRTIDVSAKIDALAAFAEDVVACCAGL